VQAHLYLSLSLSLSLALFHISARADARLTHSFAGHLAHKCAAQVLPNHAQTRRHPRPTVLQDCNMEWARLNSAGWMSSEVKPYFTISSSPLWMPTSFNESACCPFMVWMSFASVTVELA